MARRAWKAFILTYLVPQILLHRLLYRLMLHFSNNGVLTLPTGNTAPSWSFTKVFDLLWWDWSCSSFHSLVLIFSHVTTHQSTLFFSWQLYRSLNPWVSSSSSWTFESLQVFPMWHYHWFPDHSWCLFRCGLPQRQSGTITFLLSATIFVRKHMSPMSVTLGLVVTPLLTVLQCVVMCKFQVFTWVSKS